MKTLFQVNYWNLGQMNFKSDEIRDVHHKASLI